MEGSGSYQELHKSSGRGVILESGRIEQTWTLKTDVFTCPMARNGHDF